MFGVQDDKTFVLGANDASRGYSAAEALHASWLRINVRYGHPISPRTYAAEQAHSRGLSVEATLTGDPSSMPPNPTAYGQWCASAARQVPAEAYSAWNEPDLAMWFQGSVDYYRSLYLACRDGIKSVRPGARVWLGETSPHAAAFLEALGVGGLPPADGYAHHPYQWSDPMTNPDPTLLGIGNLSLLKTLIGQLPLYLTEFGYKPDNPGASWVCPAISLAKAAGARMLIFYELYPSADVWNTALLNPDGSPTAEFGALSGCT